MKKLNLHKQSISNPNFSELNHMMDELKKVYNEFEPSTAEANQIIAQIKQFQDEDGFFKLFDAFPPDKDARIDYCYNPTYYCTAILIKAICYDEKLLNAYENQLSAALEACTKRGLNDGVYTSDDNIINNLMIFINAGVSDFLTKYSYLSSSFSSMIQSYLYSYVDRDNKNIELLNSFGKAFYVFVYGSLLKGEYNHNYYLNDSKYIGEAKINNYKLYDLGSYPGIKPENEVSVLGELYLVDYNELVELDVLEGNGSLYNRKIVKCDSKRNQFCAYTYEYNHSIEGKLEIPLSCQPYSHNWKDKLVWYVSYGSNMYLKRFMCYLTGDGLPEFGVKADPNRRFKDTNLPLKSKTIKIPYEMYFGGSSSTWNNGGVAFLDVNSNKESIGRAYLITKEQYNHVKRYEGSNYQYEVELESIDGIKAVTFTNECRKPKNKPSEKYKKVIELGLSECGLDKGIIIDYIDNIF